MTHCEESVDYLTSPAVRRGVADSNGVMTNNGTAVPPTGPEMPGSSLSPRQERVARRLREQVGVGAADFFRDACELMTEQPPRRSVAHLVAHLLREVESALRSVLEPVDAAAGAKTDKHRARIRSVLNTLGISRDDVVAEFWLALAGEDNERSLATRAHRAALDAPRPLDDEFLDFVDRVEQVLDAVLERFETNYVEVFERLDALLSVEAPAAAHAKDLRNKFPGSQAVLHYFFSHASAAWVRPLTEAGFFTSPPPAELDEEAGTVQLPPWPASQYLARVAGQAPADVVEAALSTADTDNSRVNHDLVEIALAVPPDEAGRLVPKVIAALGGRFGVLIPQQVGALLVHLCRGGRVDDAMALASALLRRLPFAEGPAVSVDTYAYSVILREHIPTLVTAAGIPAFRLLTGLLADVTRTDAERRNGPPGQDWSPLWRPNIEGYEQRAESDLRHGLVNAVRDAAAGIVTADPQSLAAVVIELESHRWLIFRRLALHLLSQHAERSCDLVAARLTDATAVTDRGLEREFLLLARAGRTCLGAGPLRRFLTLVDAGPGPGPGTASSTAAAPDTPEPVVRERVARWQRDRLAAVHAVLPPEWDARYQELVTEYGQPPDPTQPVPEPFAVWSYESPVTAGELAAMPTEALVEFLKTWQPTASDWRGLSPGSLRGALSTAVQEDAQRRSADAVSFIGLPAVYTGAVLNGLWQAAANGAALDWTGVVDLSVWINQQAADELGTAADPASRQWREPRMDMLRLLMIGLRVEPSPISAELDGQVWAIIEASCVDPDPTTEREANLTNDDVAPFASLALNSVRPQAVHAAVSYGLWLRRRSPEADLNPVLSLLQQHLDVQTDHSAAVRSILGEQFPFLAWIDRQWAAHHHRHVFPTEQGREALLDAAWDGYLAGGRVTDDMWTLLADVYAIMVERVDPTKEGHAEGFRTTQLGHHLINRLWKGRIDLDSADQLLRRFYAKVPPTVATQLMWSVGRSLETTESPDPALIARLTRLWEFRVAAVKIGADGRELAEFGHWFASGHFDPAWSLQQLLTTLTLAGDLEAEAAVLSKTADLAADRLQSCLAVLQRWISLPPSPWRLTQTIDSIRRILAIGLAANSTAVDTSRKVISLLFRDHSIDLRDLLRPSPTETPPE